jgi:2,7-dihydroxy-5-methyl-1-naphthoate 7-O-methyltransferase
MGSRLQAEGPRIVAGYDWSPIGHLVDVGGGNGTLLTAILSAYPGMRGTLVELPGPADGARRVLAEAGLSDRCAIVAESFFEPLPPGADAYMLSGVVHNWDDEHATAILRRCAEAARAAAGRVLVVDELHQDGGEEEPSTEMDLRMLTYMGGRQRSLAEIEALAEQAGLGLRATHRVSTYRSVIELGP